MEKSFLVVGTNEMVHCLDEASSLAGKDPIIAGTFEETTSAWTGSFTTDDGQVYEIIDGYTAKEVQAS